VFIKTRPLPVIIVEAYTKEPLPLLVEVINLIA